MISDTLEQKQLTYQEAAHRVGLTVRTIWRWRKGGMPMSHGIREGQRVRLVDEDVLLGWFRDRLKADPVHQLRMHKYAVEEAREEGLPEPERPKARRRQKSPIAPAPEHPSPADEDDTAQSERSVDWSIVATLNRGEEQWAALSAALVKVRPACAGDPAYVADRITPQQALSMHQTCDDCPLLALCHNFAQASRPTSGFWAGQKWPRSALNSTPPPVA